MGRWALLVVVVLGVLLMHHVPVEHAHNGGRGEPANLTAADGRIAPAAHAGGHGTAVDSSDARGAHALASAAGGANGHGAHAERGAGMPGGGPTSAHDSPKPHATVPGVAAGGSGQPAALSAEGGHSAVHGAHVTADAAAAPDRGDRGPSLSSAPAPDHGPLHLCLAILAGFAALLLPLLGSAPRPAAAATGPLPATTRPGSRAPPSPVSRRLAVLCVLRR